MHEEQLQQLRHEKWRLNGQPVRTLDEAREFIDSVGFCLLYPQRPSVLAPTFVGAYKGSDDKLPTPQKAFADSGAQQAKDLMVRLLREKAAYETNVFPENNFIVSAAVFPYFYGLVGDRNPRQLPKAGPRSEYSPLALHAFQLIQREGPISKQRLRQQLGGAISESALDRALEELWGKLRITRVDYKLDEGVFWDELFRWSPEAVRQGTRVSFAEALTALVSKYLDCVLAAQQEEVEQFFSHLIGRARVREAIHALQAARELNFVHVGARVMLQVSSLQSQFAHELKSGPRTTPAKAGPRPGVPLVRHRRNSPRSRSASPAPRHDSSRQDSGKE